MENCEVSFALLYELLASTPHMHSQPKAQTTKLALLEREIVMP